MGLPPTFAPEEWTAEHAAVLRDQLLERGEVVRAELIRLELEGLPPVFKGAARKRLGPLAGHVTVTRTRYGLPVAVEVLREKSAVTRTLIGARVWSTVESVTFLKGTVGGRSRYFLTTRDVSDIVRHPVMSSLRELHGLDPVTFESFATGPALPGVRRVTVVEGTMTDGRAPFAQRRTGLPNLEHATIDYATEDLVGCEVLRGVRSQVYDLHLYGRVRDALFFDRFEGVDHFEINRPYGLRLIGRRGEGGWDLEIRGTGDVGEVVARCPPSVKSVHVYGLTPDGAEPKELRDLRDRLPFKLTFTATNR